MSKSEKIFEILRFIIENSPPTAMELSKRINISERNIYRYLDTLIEIGVIIRFQKNGNNYYKITEDWLDLFRSVG